METGQERKETTSLQLDFSGLFGETAVEATESRVFEQNGAVGVETPIRVEKPAERLTGGLAAEQAPQLYYKAQREKREREESLEICQTYQENIKASSRIQADILHGIQEGEDVYSLFLKACRIVSLTTHNELFYSQAEEGIKAIYGEGLGEAFPLQLQIEEAEKRVAKMEESLERDFPPEDKDVIYSCIKAHIARIKTLEEQLTETTEHKTE